MAETLRVLIAEDRPTDAELVLRALRRDGFDPKWQRVETEADYLQALTPDLDIILSDYQMPQFDAPRALSLLRKRGLDIPFIIVSGTIGEDTAVAAIKDGADDYLIKDRLTRLGAAVRRALEQRKERQSRTRVEAELRRFVSASTAVIYALSVEEGALEHMWTSDNVTRLTGHDHQETLSETWWAENIHPDDRDRVLGAHPTPYALDHLLLEYRFHRKDGNWVWVRDEKRLLRDSAGKPTEVVGSWVDITERKQAEAQRDELARQRQLALGAARLGWWHYDPSTRIATWDERFKEIFGVSGFQRPGEEILARLHPDDRANVSAGVQAALDAANPKPYSNEYRLNHPDGSVRWVEAHGVASFEGDGQERRATSFIGTVQDITQRRQAERRQAMQHAVTRVLAESASLRAAAPGIIQAVCEIVGGHFGALWEVDRRTNQLRCTELWGVPGLSADDLEAQTRGITFAPGVGLPGRVWLSRAPVLLPDLTRDDNYPRAASAARADLRGAFGFPILLRGDVIGVIDFMGRDVLDLDPELLEMFVGVASQIAQFIEHRSAEQQLLQAQKMEAVGQLAGGIAHDFNNLLGVILGYAQLAARDLGPDHKTTRRIESVCKAAERAAGLTRQILTFSRKQAVETRVCDLNHIVEDMEKMLRRLIGEDVRLAVALGEDLGRVRADPGQIEQVIMNLAVNARDAMPYGGRLVIETSNIDLDEAYARSHRDVRPGPHVMLAVGDTGEGMEPGTLARIFEPFFTTKEQGKGTGLGLSVVFGIVTQSGGSLSVYSEPGRGSTFKVYLPRVEEEESTAPTTPREAPRSGSETLLLVEDEDALRSLMAEALREAGYTVLEAPDPRTAAGISAQAGQEIHLLISDVVLPGQSGPETVIQLRNARPAMRTLLMSGYTDKLLNGTRAVDPSTPFLGKPFTIDALLRKVREVLDA